MYSWFAKSKVTKLPSERKYRNINDWFIANNSYPNMDNDSDRISWLCAAVL